MAFGRKAAPAQQVSQDDVAKLATEALRRQRAVRLRLAICLHFTSPLLMQRWTSKAVRKMLGSMVGIKEPKEPKDLTKDFEESWYRNERGEAAVPCRVIKAAIVEGAIATGGAVSKAELKRSLRVLGHTAPLKDAKKKMDVKIVKNATGGPDVRARASFSEGASCEVVLEFTAALTPDQVVAAVESAGACIGLFEWRPERGGDFGTFDIEILASDAKTCDRVLKQCSSPEDEFTIPQEMLKAFNAIPEEKLTDGGRKVKALIEHNGVQHGKKKDGVNGTTATQE